MMAKKYLPDVINEEWVRLVFTIIPSKYKKVKSGFFHTKIPKNAILNMRVLEVQKS